jgi:hypothetical protein
MSLVKIEPYIVDNVASFTFGGLNITANAVFGNANLGNLATANFISVSSNITAGNIGNASTYFYGNGYNLTGIVAANAAGLANGTSNVKLVGGGNASISIGGTSNVVVVTTTGVNVSGYLNATNLVGEAGNLSNIQGVNVSGTVANANYAAYAGNVTIAAQSGITSLGLLTGLSVNGNTSVIGNSAIVGNLNLSAGNANIVGNLSANNITTTGSGGNISGANNISANTFTGNLTTAAQPNITSVGTLTSLIVGNSTANATFGNGIITLTSAGNLTGGNLVSASYLTGTLTTAAQPNITSVGTLTGLTSGGIVNFTSASNVSLGAVGNVKVTGGSSGQYLQTDGTGNVSWASIALTSASISNGNSNVNIPSANGNVNISAVGNANIVVVTGTGVNVAGTLTATGNISAANITTTGSGGNISGANNISANTFTGNITTAAQPSITSLGTLTGLTVSGDTTLTGNLTVSGSFEYANVTSFRVKDPIIEQGGNTAGGALTSNDGYDRGQLLHYYAGGSAVDAFMGYKNSSGEFIFASNATVSSEVVTVNTYGNIHAGNANLGNAATSNYFIGSGNNLSNIQGANVTGPVSSATNAGTVTTAAQPNITSLGTLLNITMGSSNSLSGGNLLSASYLTGTLTTAAQPNITSVGTLTGLVVGNSTANSTFGNGTIALTSAGNINAGNLLTTNNLSVTTYVTSNLIPNANVTYSLGNSTNRWKDLWLSSSTIYFDTLSTVSAGTLTNGNSNISIPTSNGNVTISAIGNSNIVVVTGTGVNIAGTLNTGSGTITTTGNANIGNLGFGSGIITGTGNITAGNIIGTIAAGSNTITTTGNITGGNIIGPYANGNSNINIPSANGNVNISAVGNANILVVTGTGANITGTMNVSGNANVGNLGFGSGLITGTGNIISGNANLGNNVTANFFTGSGAFLTSVTAVTAGTVTTNAQPNITSTGTLTSLTVGNATANSTFGNGTITASGNISFTGANVSLGSISNLKITGGTAGYFITTDGAGNLSWGATSGGGGVSASGSNTQVQFNDGGSLGATANLTFDKTTNTLSTGKIVASIGANLGTNVGNVYIGGGSANQILKTDGSGNLSWIAQPVASITVDNYTGDGTTTAYTLSVTPTSINQTIVNYNGIFQLRASAYTISGSTITFTEAPLNGSKIEVTTTLGAMSGAGAFVTRSYSGTGSQTAYTVTSGCTVTSVIVTENGLVQTPTTDYTISGTTLTFAVAPANGVIIQIRELAIAVATASTSPITIKDEGSNLTTSLASIDFVGAGVTATNSGSNVTVTIPGGSGGVSNARVTGYNLVFGG